MHSGTVTFLFTDIEGSTRLAQGYPDIYPGMLELHNNILKKIIKDHDGFVFKTVGDAFCVSFNNETKAVNAAIEIQNELESQFSDDFKIKIRIGLHKGQAQYVNEDYIGYVTLSRVQRLMSVGNGGQILISRDIYRSIHPNGTELLFKDFGERKLKDINIPEHVYQVFTKGMQGDFPPLKTVDERQTNLPIQTTKFIGREKVIDELKTIFDHTRLLTVCGAGGTGKTRLAIEFASIYIDEFDNGIYFIELALFTNPEIIINEVCAVFNLKPEQGANALTALTNFLKDKKLLLVFDNCEHVLKKCAELINEILRSCEDARIITTSREPLGIPEETVYRLQPLALPENINESSTDELAGYESVKLFIDRATQVSSDFKEEPVMKDIAELCRRLDGIPLAIELAAKRINVLSPAKILQRLSDRFRLLTGGNAEALPKQKTLKAMIDWSYDMLSEKEQLLLQRLSLFRGGWTLETSKEICSDEKIEPDEILHLMESLLSKSLITNSELSGRFNMLESIREYAFDKLDNKPELIKKECEHYIALTDEQARNNKFSGPLEWMNAVSTEIDNIRTSIRRGVDLKLTEAVTLTLNMYDYWYDKGNFTEGLDTFKLTEKAVAPGDDLTSAIISHKISEYEYNLGIINDIEENLNKCMEVFRKEGYHRGLLDAMNLLGIKYYMEGDNDKSLKILTETLELCRENDDLIRARLYTSLSYIYSHSPDKGMCMKYKEDALKLFRKGKSINAEALTLISMSIQLTRGNSRDVAKAIQYAEESIAVGKILEDHYMLSICLIQLGSINLFEMKDIQTAEHLFLEALKKINDYGYYSNIFPVLIYLGHLYHIMNDNDRSEKYYAEYLGYEPVPASEYFVKDVFIGLAQVYFAKKKSEDSLKMIGMYDKLSCDKKYKGLISNLFSFDKEKTELKDILGEEVFNKIYDHGYNMSREEAAGIVKRNFES